MANQRSIASFNFRSPHKLF